MDGSWEAWLRSRVGWLDLDICLSRLLDFKKRLGKKKTAREESKSLNVGGNSMVNNFHWVEQVDFDPDLVKKCLTQNILCGHHISA